MGTVYKSRDTRLERTVAVKVLSTSFADDPTWRQRFDREARVLASLSNPHICPVFDVGSQNGIDFLVMEYLEGETLTARLARGPLPLDQTLRHGVDIADGLTAAHRLGVCHRDLKPGNIMLTRSGAKLLDFGLARVGPPRSSHPPNEATTSSDLTGRGTILGTVQYMSPEQLEGRETDARTDIFAFGAVMYEMATGQKAFAGQSRAAVIAAIVEHDPPAISILQHEASPALDHVVKKCLAKDPEERWQNARDLRDELKWIAEGNQQAGVPVVAVRRKRGALLRWGLVSVLSAALLTLASVHFRERTADASRVAFTVPRPRALFPLVGAGSELSPNGKRLVFPGPNPDGRWVLWIRALDSLAARPLAGTENEAGAIPFWSPDGQSLGFFADGKLKTIAVSGGPAHTLSDAPDAWGGSWSPTGIIVFSPRAGPLFKVSLSGGPGTPLFELDRSRQEVSHGWPRFLPDGHHFLYAVTSADAGSNGVYLRSLDGEEPRLLIREADGAIYSPPGHLLFARGGTLFAQPFDLPTMRITGDAFPASGHDGEVITTAWGLFSVSRNGVLSYVATRLRNYQINVYDRQGTLLRSIGDPAPYQNIVLSPDGKRLAAHRSEPNSFGNILLLELASGIATQLTFRGGGDPVWSPDGRQLAFTVFNGLTGNLYRKVIAGGDEEPFFESRESKYPQQWSTDGTSILFIDEDGKALSRLPVSADRKPQRLIQSAFAKDEFHLSPDGRWIAYNSLESGRWEVYVASFPTFGDKRQISNGGGCQARWRKDGKELFYLSLQGKLMAVDVAGGPSFEAGIPRPLFQTPILVSPLIDQYAVTGDGRQFILSTPVGEEEPITVLVNWIARMKR